MFTVIVMTYHICVYLPLQLQSNCLVGVFRLCVSSSLVLSLVTELELHV